MNTKRMRSRYHRSGNGGSRHQNGQTSLNRNHVFDSNGPDTRIRGTAQQLNEKYLQHGRDALSSGDRVAAESFFQYAEHYSRILNMMNQSAQQRQQQRVQHNNGYAENTSENTVTSSQEEQPQIQPQSEIVAEVVEAISEKPAEKNIATEQEEAPVEAPPARPRRGRPARSTTAKKKLQEESN